MSALPASPTQARIKAQLALEFSHIRKSFDVKLDATVAKILPGEYYATGDHEYITTTLGSCVSACLWDPLVAFGGMNHFMLPDAGEGRLEIGGASDAARYGSFAMEHLINAILKAGGRRERLRAKIVGGGNVLQIATNIGGRNIEFVRGYLRNEGIQIVGEDVGGRAGRLVRFHPASGAAAVKPLASTESRGLVDAEGSYRINIERKPAAGEVELF
ncbi:MAG: chemoreceptor glutamine deamidase CheD [Gammaproteobacteria bacterium]